jgi:uncharacterized glyoxalase superfamily protein PhnB
MTNPQHVRFGGLTPYLYCHDAAAMAEWLTRVFGFVEKGRHRGEDGSVRNVELAVGASEIWLDGYPGHRVNSDGPPPWLGVWVDDVDGMYARVLAAGIEAAPPVNKPWGVRMLSVKDPEGLTWGFMKRL